MQTPDGSDTATAVAHGAWHPLAVSPSSLPMGPLLAWDGSELLQIGGILGVASVASVASVTSVTGSATGSATSAGTPVPDTAAHSPNRSRWRRLAPVPWPLSAFTAVAVGTGARLVVLTADAASSPRALADRRTPTGPDLDRRPVRPAAP